MLLYLNPQCHYYTYLSLSGGLEHETYCFLSKIFQIILK